VSSERTGSVRPQARRAVLFWGLLRALLSTTVLVILYFVGPLEQLEVFPFGLSLAIAAGLLLGLSVWEIRGIFTSPHPGLRGVEALAIVVPLYVLLFAAAYYVMSLTHPQSFDVGALTRVDALYFTVTTFSSVGFGDIAAASQDARMMVTVQMVLNLLVLGVGIRVFVGAVRRSRGIPDPELDAR